MRYDDHGRPVHIGRVRGDRVRADPEYELDDGEAERSDEATERHQYVI